MDDPIVAMLNRDLGEVYVDQQTNKAFRQPRFRYFNQIHHGKGKISRKVLLLKRFFRLWSVLESKFFSI